MTARTRDALLNRARSSKPWFEQDMVDLVDTMFSLDWDSKKTIGDTIKTYVSKNVNQLIQNASTSFDIKGDGFLTQIGGEWVFDDSKYLVKDVADLLYAGKNHNHDDRYYLKKQVDDLIPKTHNVLGGRDAANSHPFGAISGVLLEAQFPLVSGDVENIEGSTDLSVTGLGGHALPTLGVSPGSLRWSGASWVLDEGAAVAGVHNDLTGRSDMNTHPFSSLSGVLGNTQFPALSGDVSNTVGTVAITVNKLSGQALPAFGATPANFRWNGSAWTMDTTVYAPNSSLGNYVLKSGDTMTGNLAINAVTAGWSEGIRIIAASGAWGGLRLSRNNLASSTDGNWAFGYANNATSDFEIDVQQGASQFKWGKFYKSGGGVVNGAWAVTDTLRYSGGIFRDLVQAPTLYSAFYGSGVTPGSGATYNYSLALKKDGVESWLSGTTSSHLAVNGVYVVRALAAGAQVAGTLTTTGNLILPGATFRDDTYSSATYAVYGSGVTPNNFNGSIYIQKDGGITSINGSIVSALLVGGATKVAANSTGAQVTGTLSSTGNLTAPSATIGLSTAMLKRVAGVLTDASSSDLPGGPYLPIAGGTITGTLGVNGVTTLNSDLVTPGGTIGLYGTSFAIYRGANKKLWIDDDSVWIGGNLYPGTGIIPKKLGTPGLLWEAHLGETWVESLEGMIRGNAGKLEVASSSYVRASLAMPNKEVVFGSAALGVSSSPKFLFDGNNASLSGGSKFYFGGELGGGNIYQSFDNVRISSDLNITSPSSTDGNGSIVFNVDDGNSVVNIARFESGGIGYTGGPNAIFESHVYVEKTLNCLDEINMLGDVYLDQEIVTTSTYTLPDVPARATKQIIFNVTSCDVSTGTQGVSLRRDDGSLGNEAAGTVIAASFGKTGNRMRSILLVGVTSTMASIIG